MALTTELHVIRATSDSEARYLNYLVSSRPFLHGGEAEMIGVAGQKRVPDSWLRNFPVFVKDTSTQRAIADFLDAETARIDALIAKKLSMTQLLTDRLQAQASDLTKASITTNPADTARVPVGWRFVLLRRCIAESEYGIGEASKESGRVAVLGMGNVDDNGGIVGEVGGYVDTVSEHLLLRSGDLLFNRTNSLAKVGKVALLRKLNAPTTFASYLVRIRTTPLADAEYLNYLLNTKEILGLARSAALPSIGQANLNPSRYAGLHIPLPPIEEQLEIVSELDAERARIESLVITHKRQIALLQEHRQALITAAVTGEMKVPGVAR